MFEVFIIGNIIYYAVGIILAYAFKDNRAFCKYICSITIFLKPMSYFSMLRIKCDKSKCVSCSKCKNVCPMEVDVTDNSRFNLEIDYSNHATALTGEPSQLSSFNGKQLNQNKSLPHNSKFLRFSMFTISHF